MLASRSFRQLGVADAPTNTFGDLLAGRDRSTRQHTHKLFAPKSGCEISLSDCLSDALGNKPKDLVSKLMTVLVVESLEVVYIDKKDAESFSMLHHPDLLGAQEGVKSTSVGKTGQCICVGIRFCFLKVGPELLQLLRRGA